MIVFRGRVWKFGDSIDTDVISPGGDRGARLRETTMTAVRPEFPREVKPGDIIVAGRNFGCGSHRETANIILRDAGIAAIIAESLARIFFRVSISLAYPAFNAPGITAVIEDGEELEINYDGGFIMNVKSRARIPLIKYPSSIEEIFRAGGILPLLKERFFN
jgi:3-isopropylmalate dehydratase small subunit